MFKNQVLLLFVALMGMLGMTAVVASASTAEAPATTPQPVLTFFENISEWQMTSGFIYLTDNCMDFSSQTTAYIRRRATNGTTLSLLQSINTMPQCRTFRRLAVDESGIYYYNRNLGRIEAIYSDAPNDPPTPLATIGDWDRIGFGDGISNLRLDSSYVYWIEQIVNGEFSPDDVAIKRVSKTGGTPTTLLTYSSLAAKQVSLDGLGITGGRLWWTDSDGLNRISTCTFQVCFPGTNTKVTEVSLAAGDGHIEISGSNVLWWSGDENPERIRRTSCPFFSNDCSTSTVYTASNSVTVIGVAATNEVVFWTEDVSLVGRRLRRKALSGGTAETLREDVYYAAPYVDSDGVYFQEDIRHIARLPFGAEAITHEIGVASWEVTQGVQRPVNDVPLVAGKTTYVRLYPTLEDGTNVGAATAALYGSRNGQPLPGSPVYPLNISIPISSALSLADRDTVDSGWLFRLPESWTRTGETLIPQEDATVTLRAVIDPNGFYADSDNPNNNEITADFLFTAKAPTCMRMRPVITHASYQPVYGYNIAQLLELTEGILPTPKLISIPSNDPLREIDWCWKGIIYGPFCSTPYELNDDDSGLLTKMGWHDYWADSPAVCFTNNARTLYAGIVHKDATWDWGGLARRGKDQFLTKVPEYGDSIDRFNGLAMTMVHEIGHNYGRKHIQCPLPTPDPNDDDGSPLNPDFNYPYPTNMLDFSLAADNLNLHYGFDPLLQMPISPTTTSDFMSYCGPEWYSDYTWRAIFNNTRDPIFTFPDTLAEGELVRVAGIIDVQEGWGTLDYAWTVPSAAASIGLQERWAADLAPAWDSRAAQATYHLQLIGLNGQVLADHVIELTDISDGEKNQAQPFELTFAAPAAMVMRLQLMQGNTILTTLTPGTGQPALTLTQPTAGATIGDEITVSWTAADPDDDQLLYTIQYSPNNGGEWYPLLVNYGGTSAAAETVTLDLSAEAGSEGAKARIRVLASDGYNTTIATSPPFTVAPRAPFVDIASPADAQTYGASQTIPLLGRASDPEDGLIAEDQFIWSTGQTGSTAELSGLAPGPHTLQLTATDSDGLDGSATVDFTVAPLAVPETAASFVLDGRCDDVGYQNAVQLPLTPYGDGPRASARLIHTNSKMWLCLTGLQGNEGYVGLLVDEDNSGEAAVQSGDFGYFVQPDGTRFVQEGNGSNFGQASASKLSARIFDNGTVWSAELQIDDSAFGSWRQRVRLAIGHFAQTGGATSTWPRTATLTNPQSWGQTNLGLEAALTAVSPEAAVWGTGPINLMVSGTNFESDNVVLWNSAPLSTTLVNTTTLTAVVPANLVPAAGVYEVAVDTEGANGLTTAAYPFTVNNPQPVITSLSPNTVEDGSAAQVITIKGNGFVNGATVLWDGVVHTTTYDSATQLHISVTAAELATARSVPVVVVNPEPAVEPSETAVFVVATSLEQSFMPRISR